MFDNSSIMVLLNDGNENLVQLLEVDTDPQAAVSLLEQKSAS